MAPSTRWFLARVLRALLVLTLWLAVRPAVAQPQGVDEEAGRKHAVAAMGAYKAGDYPSALSSFEKARQVYPTGQVLRMTGYTLLALERWREAADTLTEAMHTSYKPLSDDDSQDAHAQLEQALRHVGKVSITSEVDGATLSIDDGPARELPATVHLDPGEHAFVVSAEGHDDGYRTEEVEAGQQLSFTLDPRPQTAGQPEEPKPTKPAPEEPPDEGGGGFGWFSGQGTLGLVTAGVGLVAGGFGIGALVYGSSLRSAVQENMDAHQTTFGPSCADHTELCTNDIALINRDGERAQTWQNLGTAMTITGGALLVVGTTLFLLSDDSPLAPDDESSGDAALRCLPALGGSPSAIGTLGFGCAGSF